MLRRIAGYLRANVLGALALFVALGGTSVALSHGFVGSGGTIRGCVNASGQLRLVKPNGRCSQHQSIVTWNQKGKPGAPAPRYAAGAGLVLSGNTFGTDPSVMQRRVGTDCRVYSAVSSDFHPGAIAAISPDGSASCLPAALAVGFVNGIGAGSSGLSSSRVGIGQYCLSVAGGNFAIVTAWFRHGTPPPTYAPAYATSDFPADGSDFSPDCPQHQIEVRTYNAAGSPLDSGFFAAVYG